MTMSLHIDCDFVMPRESIEPPSDDAAFLTILPPTRPCSPGFTVGVHADGWMHLVPLHIGIDRELFARERAVGVEKSALDSVEATLLATRIPSDQHAVFAVCCQRNMVLSTWRKLAEPLNLRVMMNGASRAQHDRDSQGTCLSHSALHTSQTHNIRSSILAGLLLRQRHEIAEKPLFSDLPRAVVRGSHP